MASKLDSLSSAYIHSPAEKQALELVKKVLKEGGVSIAFPIREKNGGKRWGINIFTRNQLTIGLGSEHAVLALMQGAHESEANFIIRAKAYGIEAEELIERSTKK